MGKQPLSKKKLEKVLEYIQDAEFRGQYTACLCKACFLKAGDWDYLEDYRPGIFSKFFWNWNYRILDAYWWSRDEAGIKCRIEYLKYLIKHAKAD